MNTQVAQLDKQAPQAPKKGNLIARCAARFGIDEGKLLPILKATAFSVKDAEASDAQMAALLVVADQYSLNPFTRELFAFPDKQNGIVPVVSVDGWARIINEQEQLDGIEFEYSDDLVQPGDPRFPGLKHPAHEWVACVIHRKDRHHPTRVREWLDEVYRPPFVVKRQGKEDWTVEGAWQSHTRRMHRHKVLIQASRIAFGFAGIYDEDEAQRIIDVEPIPAPQQQERSATERLRTALDVKAETGEPEATETPKPPQAGEKGTADLLAKFVAAIAAAGDPEICALKRDEARMLKWTKPQEKELDDAFDARIAGLSEERGHAS